MKLEQYISQLLYRYQCVTVPGFGAFLTETQSAQLIESTNSFCPPKKMISFNGQLKNNDGLLATHIARGEKTSYEYAVSAIGYEILNWKKTLQETGVLTLKNIGDIRLNVDGKLVFTPVDQNNYLTSSFGLSPFIAPQIKREIFEQKVEALEQQETENEVVELFTEETKKPFSLLKYAAIFVIGLGVAGSIGYPMYQNQITSQTVAVETKVQKEVQNRIQEATFFIKTPMPAVTLTVEKQAEPEVVKPYHIVAGAFRTEKKAENFRQDLIKSGYEANVLPQNKHGLIPVVYGSFTTMNEAQKLQREINKAENPDAWILIETLEK